MQRTTDQKHGEKLSDWPSLKAGRRNTPTPSRINTNNAVNQHLFRFYTSITDFTRPFLRRCEYWGLRTRGLWDRQRRGGSRGGITKGYSPLVQVKDSRAGEAGEIMSGPWQRERESERWISCCKEMWRKRRNVALRKKEERNVNKVEGMGVKKIGYEWKERK